LFVGPPIAPVGGEFAAWLQLRVMRNHNPFFGVLLLLIVGAGLGLGFNALRPQPLPWVASPKTAVKLESLSPPVASAEPAQEAPAATDPASETATRMNATDGAGDDDAPAPAESAPPTSAREEPAPAGTTAAQGTNGKEPEGNAAPAEAGSKEAAAKAEAKAEALKKLYADIPESDVPIDVTLAKAKEFYDRGGLLVLDARDPDEYAAGHIMGALDAPYDDKVGDIDWLMKTAKDPRPILCYCNGGECELGLDLGTEISRTGHKRVLILTDGYPAWRNAGYPIAAGKKP
jgi:rhodanese-related sulfurtransferase